MAGDDVVGRDLPQVRQGAMAGCDNGPVDLGAGEALLDRGGVEPGVRDGRGVRALVGFVVTQWPRHTVVLPLAARGC